MTVDFWTYWNKIYEEEKKSGFSEKTIPEGTLNVRIINTPEGPFKTVWKHYGVNGLSGDEGTFFCNARNFPQEKENTCLVCIRVNQLYSSEDPDDKAEANRIRARRKQLVWFGNVNDPESPAEMYHIPPERVGEVIRDEALKLESNLKEEGHLKPGQRIDISDPKTGRTIRIKRTGTGRDDTKYSVMISTKASPLPNPNWLKQATGFSHYIRKEDQWQIAEILGMEKEYEQFIGTPPEREKGRMDEFEEPDEYRVEELDEFKDEDGLDEFRGEESDEISDENESRDDDELINSAEDSESSEENEQKYLKHIADIKRKLEENTIKKRTQQNIAEKKKKRF